MISRHDIGIGCIGKWKDKKEKEKKKENRVDSFKENTGQHYQSNRKDTYSKFGEANELDKNRSLPVSNKIF